MTTKTFKTELPLHFKKAAQLLNCFIIEKGRDNDQTIFEVSGNEKTLTKLADKVFDLLLMEDF